MIVRELPFWILPALVVGGVFGVSQQGLSEAMEGTVRVSGSSLNKQTEIVPKEGKLATRLCSDAVVTRIEKLPPMVIKVEGEWTIGKKGEKKCFGVQDFTPLRHANGRIPLIGVLKERGGQYVVAKENGVEEALRDVSPGLKKLLGQKVLLDVKPMDVDGTEGGSLKIVTYGPYP